MEIVSKLFGSESKVKIMRLFLFNPNISYDLKEVAERSKIKEREANNELEIIEKIGLIKSKRYVKEIITEKGRGGKKKKHIKKIKVTGFMLNESFPYMIALKNLLVNVTLPSNEEISKRFSNVGRIKLLIMSGLFIQEWDSRVDLLIVGDSIKKKQLDNVIKNLEAEIGKELRYSMFETSDFHYRLGIFDKLIRDILDFNHVKMIDKLGIE
ncbi:MAG: hypothetical protein NUV47_02325 [Patescibacteria group bacterium]|nr:hypothetical protein [Patescibacteria group bacterium]